MKFYKLKHIPTQLYFQPHKHRGSHLSKNGKIYQTDKNGLSSAFKRKDTNIFNVQCEKNSTIHKLTKDILIWTECRWSYNQLTTNTNLIDWEKEYIN